MRRIAFLALAALVLTAGAAQESRRVLTWLEIASPAAAMLDREAWAASLDAALASSSRIGAVRRAASGGAEADQVEEAARLGFDLAVALRLEQDDTGIQVSWALYDIGAPAGPEAELRAAAEGGSRMEGPAAGGPPATFWLGLLGAADKLLSELPPAGTAVLKIEAPAGTKIGGFSKKPAVVPESGELELRLRSTSSYSWRASLAGHEDETGLLSVSGREARLSIVFAPRLERSLESGLVGGAFPDLWFSWRFAEGRLFARAGLIQYLWGMSLRDSDESDETPSLFVSYGLVEPGAGIGVYASPPDDPVRFYASLDAALRVDLISDSTAFIIMVDPVAPLEFKPAFGLEWAPAGRFSLFFELGSSIFPFSDGILMASERASSGSGSWPHITGDNCYTELFIMRFGARCQL